MEIKHKEIKMHKILLPKCEVFDHYIHFILCKYKSGWPRRFIRLPPFPHFCIFSKSELSRSEFIKEQAQMSCQGTKAPTSTNQKFLLRQSHLEVPAKMWDTMG